jgi:hypothetical protein
LLDVEFLDGVDGQERGRISRGGIAIEELLALSPFLDVQTVD